MEISEILLSLSEFRHHLTKTAWSELLEMLPVIAACKEICKIDSLYKYLIRGPDKRKKDGAILSPTDYRRPFNTLVQGDGRSYPTIIRIVEY